jgi:23S rRNA pseudouridine1911/1915/1917 synthase
MMKINILYEDNHLLVTEKPPGILSQADASGAPDMLTVIKAYLKETYQKTGNVFVGLVHRLDRRVGGVMVFAKTSKAASRLSEAIRNREMDKKYLVKVKGLVEKDGAVTLTIAKDEKEKKAFVAEEGKTSLLYYRVICKNTDTSVLEVDLITGRFHQIRLSMMEINHPIVNDYKYDEDQSSTRQELGLWCYQISFPHPISKEKKTFTLFPTSTLWEKELPEIQERLNSRNI